MRRLHQNARAVAGVRLATARAAMPQIHQDGERLPHDVMRLPALEVDDKADAAGVVFEPRIVQPLFLGPTVRRGAANSFHGLLLRFQLST